MAPVMLHAAVFDTTISQIALIEPYSSYISIVKSRFYTSSFNYGAFPGALKLYDLHALEACLAPRKLLMAGVPDGSGKNTDIKTINAELEIIKTVYQNKNVAKNLKIVSLQSGEKLNNVYMEWLK
jgi:hypothetical protein